MIGAFGLGCLKSIVAAQIGFFSGKSLDLSLFLGWTDTGGLGPLS